MKHSNGIIVPMHSVVRVIYNHLFIDIKTDRLDELKQMLKEQDMSYSFATPDDQVQCFIIFENRTQYNSKINLIKSYAI